MNTEDQKSILPNSNGVLVLGILSLVFAFCYGIIGLILGIISLVLANKAAILYSENTHLYTLQSYNNMKAGRICAIIRCNIFKYIFDCDTYIYSVFRDSIKFNFLMVSNILTKNFKNGN